MNFQRQEIIGIAIAALGGAAVGLEREWSGHAEGPNAHFAGIRTFTLLGLLAGVIGWFWSHEMQYFSLVLLSGCTALVVVAYFSASARSIDGTTEMAALVVLAAGVLAGVRYLGLASILVSVTTLLLVEKSRLHAVVARIDDTGLRAAARFAVMAVVILPLLPPGPYGPLGGIRPRELWLFVLLFSGLSFLGYFARRAIGPERGYTVLGLLGGFISSTALTFSFARRSKEAADSSVALAIGAVAACTVMNLRVLAAITILKPDLALALVPYLTAPLMVGASVVLFRIRAKEPPASVQAPSNPLQFASAVQTAALFQVVLFMVFAIESHWGTKGILTSGVILGFADIDVLTITITKSLQGSIPLGIAAKALALGILSNTVFKLLIAIFFGRGKFRTILPAALTLMAIASAISILLLG